MKKNTFPYSCCLCRFLQSSHKMAVLLVLLFICSVFLCGCFETGYSSESLFPEDVSSVYVKMFDNRSFYRDMEYKLTDALSKRIESQAPYKVISSGDRADTELTGYIESTHQATLSRERQTGRALEKELRLTAVVNWKDLKTGKLLIDNRSVSASASFSRWQNQGLEYASALAANDLARKIVELMEKEW